MTSFPKAKIHRFNEDVSCAPPPGTYDPKLDTAVKGCPIQKEKRFPDQQCISKSMDNINNGTSTDTGFRTPQVMRKLVKLTPKLQQSRDRLFSTPDSSSSMSSTSNDKIFKTPGTTVSRLDYRRLEEKLTFLSDKHLAEVHGLQSEIFKLQESLTEVEHRENEIKLILKEKSEIELERRNELLSLKQNVVEVEAMLNKERKESKMYIDELKSQISVLEAKKDDLEGIISEKQSVIMTMNEKYNDLENELKLLTEEKQNYKKEIESLEEKESELLSKFLKESENKVEQLEEQLKTKVRNLEEHVDEAQSNAQAECLTKINFLNHEFELKTSEYKNQLKSYSSKFEQLKKLVDQSKKECLSQIKEVDENCRFLYRELCDIEGQRDELLVSDLEKKILIVEMQENSSVIENDLKSYKDKCKKYEITLSTMQNTINALGVRLLDTENEVTRLNSVEVDLESKKKRLEEESQLLTNNIMVLRESMEEMEKQMIFEVNNVKQHLEAQVDYFKMESAKTVHLLNEEIHNKQSLIDKLLSELDTASVLINEFNSFKISSENQTSSLKNEVEDCKTALSNAEKEIFTLKNENRKQLDSIKLLNDQLVSSQEIIAKKIQNEVKQQQSIDGLISDLVLEKERCLALEAEKDKAKISFSEIKTSNTKKDQEIEELNVKLDCMNRSLKNLEEKVSVTDEEKGMLEMQLVNAETNISELKQENKTLKEKLEIKISEFQYNLDLTQQHIIAENNFCSKISCLEAEKSGLSMQLDEALARISELESVRAEKNVIINQLSEHVSIEQAKYNDYVSQTQKTFEVLKKHNEGLKMNADNGIKLQAAEEKITHLEEEMRKLHLKHENRKVLEMEAQQLREDAEVLRLKLQVVTNERNKLDQEVAELMGHQNIHQKIKHINQLKQANIEVRERADKLEIENALLKKKLAEFKENAKTPLHQNSPKTKKIKPKTNGSPAVLKDRNC